MMMRNASISDQNAKGFSLLELLMVTALIALLLSGLYKLFDDWMQRTVNRKVASEMMRVQKASEDFVFANFDTLRTTSLNIFTEIPMANLRANNYLPTGFQAINSFQQNIRSFRRTLRVNKLNPDGTNATDPAGNPIFIFSIEVVTVSDNPAPGVVLRVPNKRLLDTAQAGGPSMGVITNLVLGGTTFVNRATSLFSEWWVTRASLAAAGYGATPNANGGYLAAYGLINAESTEANDEWLYRVQITNRPELNRMATNLRMNSNSLQNTGSIVTDRMNVTGNASFLGQAQGVAAETAQAMTVEQALRVDGGGESRINMKDTNGACTLAGGANRTLTGIGCSIAGGEVQVISSNASAADATMNIGTLTADGSVITDITNVGNTTQARGVSTFTTTTGASLTNSGLVITPTATVTGNTVQTQQMQAGNMAVGGGAAVNGNLVAARAQPNGSSVTSTAMDVANTAVLNGNIHANTMNANTSMYIKGIIPTSYWDPVMGRSVVCTQWGGKTYCEPSGTHNWPNGTSESCQPSAGSYFCDYYRGGVFQGRCTYNRTTGASGQAYHQFAGCVVW